MIQKITSFLLLLLVQTIGIAQSNQSSDLAIINAKVIPMDTEQVLDNQVVLIRGSSIIEIGSTSQVVIPAGAQIIDVDGKFLMPGLADMHIHLRNEDELINYLNYGVTTVMHLGGTRAQGRRNLAFREKIADGHLLGPKIYTTGRIFDGDPPASGGAYRISSPELAKELVAELAKDGFDFIKIYNNVSYPVFETIVSEGNKLGLPVIGHIPRNIEPLLTFKEGQRMAVHSEEFFFTYFKGPRSTKDLDKSYRPDYSKIPALVQILIDNKIAVIPNLSYAFADFIMWDDIENLFSDTEIAYVSPALIRNEFHSGNINRRSNIENFVYRDQMKYNLSQELTREFQKSGILQLLGTDATQAGLFPGKSAHRELTELVKAGLSNYEALSIATKNAGVFVKNEIKGADDFGQLKAGFRADIILLDKNPLEDVRNVRSIKGVVTQGKWISMDTLAARRTIIASQYKSQQDIDTRLKESVLNNTTESVLADLTEQHINNAQLMVSIESSINSLGYSYMRKDEFQTAIKIFELNTIYFSTSANTWDSYAESFLSVDNKAKAIEFYKKALEVDPTLSSAKSQLERLEK